MKDIKFHEQSEGWTVEYSASKDSVVHIHQPNEQGGGFVSIDFNSRTFELGHCWPRRAWNETTYAGRGWRDQIVVDAVAMLSAAMK